jgi:voltage-gated potassium channel
MALVVYRLWEMFIVNVWLFLIYRQIGRGRKDPFDYVRVIISLSWQYLTVLIGYSIIYRAIYFGNSNSFVGIQNDRTITWIYYSLATMTTLGYGDIHPCQNCGWAQLAVITEVFLGILYIVWFLGAIINKLEMQWPGDST